ncbi:MAG: SAM-dependent methyltransferase [Candidatus Neomarinimicrobiota bacterium]
MERTRRIDNYSSRTANYTCMCRASSYLENNPLFKSGDYIAVKLLPRFIKLLLLCKILNLKGKISPKGIYQYVIVRTKYLDNIFIESIKKGIDQVVILGAGFDSRAIRLLNETNRVKVYEIDVDTTVNAKLKQYEKRKIKLPSCDILIPVDFEKENIKTKLNEFGFNSSKKTLFILEGLTMYLSENSVSETFNFITNNSSRGSIIAFDYVHASVLRLENKYFGENAIYNRVKKDNEQWIFGIDESEIESFLMKFNLSLVDHLNSIAMEERYFKNDSGKIVTKVNGTHCIVLAKK